MANDAVTPARVSGEPRRLYYGWTLVGTLALTELVSWGILYYVFTVIQTPIGRELGWSSAAMTGAFSLALLISGLSALPVGRWLDRQGPRVLMTLGSCLATVLVLALATVQTLPAFYLVWAGIGVTMAMVLYEPAFAVVATWFVRQRGRALTLLTLGGGLASVVFVPLADWLVRQYGWRTALIVLAVVLAIVTIPLHALVLRRSPSDMGYLPDGERVPGEPSRRTEAAQGRTLRAAVRGSAFWWLALAFGLNQIASVALGVHLIPLLVEQGYPSAFAATALAVLGGSQLAGRLIFAPLSERLSHQAVAALMFALHVLALGVLLASGTGWGVIMFAIIFGAGAGASTPARAVLVADLYGARHYGSINGALAFLLTCARAAAPISASLLYGAVQGYTPLLWTAAVLCGGATAAVLLANERYA